MEIELIIAKYLNNSADEEDKTTLLRWLEESGNNRTDFRHMYDLWLYGNASLTSDEEMEMALCRFKKRMSGHVVSIHSLKSYFVRIAISVLLLFSAGYIGYFIRDNAAETLVTNRVITGESGKGKYVLPDGSTVWLNANSTLEYPELFAGEKRIVRLEGEALFEVVKDVKKPFFVQSGGIEVEVSGTRFLVNNYHNKPVTETMLVNGSVKIGGSYFPTSRILHPGQLVTYNKETAEFDIRMVHVDDYTNWIHSELVFDKTNLANVVINLKKWYGVEIITSPGLTEDLHMSFTIRRESLDEILKYMSITAPISYKWKGNRLYLSSKE
ncbi:MAG: FecR domain-containing protein [Tannerella sp.]|jgi:ferric-dicitrate binding protein FerR (iron transport regulator)|nr:FecR domain-containing protein [Tannerella sp.]